MRRFHGVAALVVGSLAGSCVGAPRAISDAAGDADLRDAPDMALVPKDHATRDEPETSPALDAPASPPFDATQEAPTTEADVPTESSATVDVSLETGTPDASVEDAPTSPPRHPLPASDCGRPFCTTEAPGGVGAIALADIDGDHYTDALVGEVGPGLAGLGPLRVLRNVRGEGFEDTTARAGLEGWGAWSMTFGDLDGDGDADLVLGGRRRALPEVEQGALRVFDNDGSGRFVERAVGQLPDGGDGVPVSVRLADFDLDGRTDIVAGYGGTDPRRSYFDRVLLQRPDGSWAQPSEPLDDPGFTWLALPTDIDRDGRPDLLVANDAAATIDHTLFEGRVLCPLPRLLPPETFRHVGAWLSTQRVATVDAQGELSLGLGDSLEGFTGVSYTPMGLVAADLDGDGLDDYLGTNSGVLWYCRSRAASGCRRGAPQSVFDLRTAEGVPPVSWSPRAMDIDRDGDLDLVITFGGVTPSRTTRSNAVLLNDGAGHFSDAPADHGLDVPGWWSALAAADFDRDGDEDLLLGAQSLYRPFCAGPVASGRLARNSFPTAGRHAVLLRLRGTVSNPDALGARVRVLAGGRTLVRTVTQGGATQSADTPALVVGVGATTRPLAWVHWPGGAVQDLGPLETDRWLERTEPRWATVEPPSPFAGETVTVLIHTVFLPAAPWSLRLTLPPGVPWSEAPALHPDGTLRGRFVAPPRRRQVAVQLSAPGEAVAHTFRVLSR